MIEISRKEFVKRCFPLMTEEYAKKIYILLPENIVLLDREGWEKLQETIKVLNSDISFKLKKMREMEDKKENIKTLMEDYPKFEYSDGGVSVRFIAKIDDWYAKMWKAVMEG